LRADPELLKKISVFLSEMEFSLNMSMIMGRSISRSRNIKGSQEHYEGISWLILLGLGWKFCLNDNVTGVSL